MAQLDAGRQYPGRQSSTTVADLKTQHLPAYIESSKVAMSPMPLLHTARKPLMFQVTMRIR